MKCQEVMEYMQRELDGDLDEIEFAKAHKHIRQCADCSAMYERLRRLSAELENLPKVTPPISLVDAILPKLDEIDRLKTAAGAEAGAAELAGASGNTARTAPRRRNNRFSLRVLSGVVAAGVVAGIFLVVNNQDRLDDSLSGIESSSSGSSEQPMLMMDASDASSSAARASSADALKKSANIGRTVDQAGGAMTAPSDDSAKQPASDRSGDGGRDAGGSDSGAVPGAGEVRMEPPAVLEGSDDGIGVAGVEEDGGQLVVTGFVDQYGPIESASPDGAYNAVFAESRVIIYDQDGNTRFEGEARQGAIAAMGWSEDGAFFRYEIRLEDGTSELYRIDLAEGTETKE
jgi:hypothetical protein